MPRTHLIAGATPDTRTDVLQNGKLDKLALADYRWTTGNPEALDAKNIMSWTVRDSDDFKRKPAFFADSEDESAEADDESDDGEMDGLTKTDDFYVVNERLNTPVGHVSDDYRPVPDQWIAVSLTEALQNMGLDDAVSGLVRQYPAGVYMDLYFDHDTTHYEIDGVADTISSGLSVHWRHDGNSTVTVRPFIRFGNCRNTMRDLRDENNDRIEFKLYHRGNLNEADIKSDLHEGITEMLFRLGTLKSQLTDPIKDAKDTSIDPADYDFSSVETDHDLALTELYRGLGLPGRLAEAATARAAWRAGHLANVTEAAGSNANDRQRLLGRLSDDLTYAAIDVVNGLTWAIKYVSNADLTGSTYNGYQRTAYDLLMNPEERVEEAHADRVGDLDAVDDEVAAEEIAARIETLDA